jgi:hypothetical protein
VNKEELMEKIFSGKNAEIKLPCSHWAMILEQLDDACDSAIERMKTISSFDFIGKSHDSEHQREFAAPFLARALIVEKLKDEGLLAPQKVGDRDMGWIEELFDSPPDSVVQ